MNQAIPLVSSARKRASYPDPSLQPAKNVLRSLPHYSSCSRKRLCQKRDLLAGRRLEHLYDSTFLLTHPALSLAPDVTGPTNAKVGLVTIFDVFGLVPQTLQGADVLAEALNAVVLVPDFFHGDSAQWSWFDKENAQIVNQKALMDFIATTASFEKNIPALLNVVAEAKSLYPTVEKWGSYGLCWGGKVSSFIPLVEFFWRGN